MNRSTVNTCAMAVAHIFTAAVMASAVMLSACVEVGAVAPPTRELRKLFPSRQLEIRLSVRLCPH